jgi:hypothetical protein
MLSFVDSMSAPSVDGGKAFNARMRFEGTMRYTHRDRVPLLDFGYWPETIAAWYEQGLPRAVNRTNIAEYFGLEPFESLVISSESPTLSGVSSSRRDPLGVWVGLVPPFPEKVLEHCDGEVVVQQMDGVRVRKSEERSAVPHAERYLLTDRKAWKNHYKPRLNPNHTDRYPHDWAGASRRWCNGNRDYPLFLPAGSLYGWIRNWMGVEAVSLLAYDDPAWLEEMVSTIADCICGVLKRVLETGAHFEGAMIWEDMCYGGGPLFSPELFTKFLSPHYKRITELLRSHGCHTVMVDCDGRIDDLVPLWLDAGINAVMPVEVGVWKGDPVALRKKFGRELRMLGGFDKRILARGKADIEGEVYRLAPLVDEGGYIPFCDHRVPPDVSYENYLHFVRLARKVWAKNINLRPMAATLEG